MKMQQFRFSFGLVLWYAVASSKGTRIEWKDDWLSFDMHLKNCCKQKEHKPKSIVCTSVTKARLWQKHNWHWTKVQQSKRQCKQGHKQWQRTCIIRRKQPPWTSYSVPFYSIKFKVISCNETTCAEFLKLQIRSKTIGQCPTEFYSMKSRQK